jgi:hypothetical protein
MFAQLGELVKSRLRYWRVGTATMDEPHSGSPMVVGGLSARGLSRCVSYRHKRGKCLGINAFRLIWLNFGPTRI